MSIIFKFFAIKFQGLKMIFYRRKALKYSENHLPILLEIYKNFNAGNQLASPRQPYKGWDTYMLLEKFKPSYIVEMGSGTSSAVFSLWANQNNSKYTCYENHPHWGKVTKDILNEKDIEIDIRIIPDRVSEDGKTTGFKEIIPEGADFIYIDGPPCKVNGKKVPNDDILRFFDSGGRPRTIVVDGRVATCDLIINSDIGIKYNFYPSFVYCLRNSKWLKSIKSGEHSVFTLDQDSV